MALLTLLTPSADVAHIRANWQEILHVVFDRLCGAPPTEISWGVVTGNFNGTPFSASLADGTLAVFFNDKSSPGTLKTPVVLSSPGASQLAIGDMNHDGLPDLVSAGYGVSLFLQSTSGTFAAPISLYPGGANWVAVGDLNGDGNLDVAKASPGTFLAPVSYPIAAQDLPQSIVVKDVDGDGRADIVIGGQQTVTVLLQNHAPAAPGTYMTATVYAAPGANEIAVADINGDGKPDIVVSNGVTNPTVNGVVTTNPGVLLQSNTSPGSFGALQNLP